MSGERAFPSGDFTNCEPGYGLTKREWFAGMALQNPAICTGTARDWELGVWFKGRTGIMRDEIVAYQAFQYADAMLAAGEAQ